ncbi:MAG: hypothetical protein KZQ83_16315 [gamma proteobacterium symbiont of Taylorina sp.]|nr:hypothetical protein [gamma proteobacterium symbiont of Taylorina sp.]
MALINGYAIVEYLTKQFPDIKLLKIESLYAGIDTVFLHQADVYIDAYPKAVERQLAASLRKDKIISPAKIFAL